MTLFLQNLKPKAIRAGGAALCGEKALQRIMKRDFSSVIASWPFVFSLSALLLNDLWLKAAYPGLFTGKLSDVAGVAVVAFVFFALFPHRALAVYLGLAALFGWWKSPLSQSGIDAVNGLLPFTIGRVVDYTDLLALFVLFPCHRFATSSSGAYAIPWRSARRMLFPPLVGATIFGLMATSVLPTRHEYVVRPSDPMASFSKQAVAESIAEVAERNGLSCMACESLTTKATYSNDGVYMTYSFPLSNAILFQISAAPSGVFFGESGKEKAERLRSDLKKTLALRFKGLEYVEKLN